MRERESGLLEQGGFRYHVHRDVYEPHDDTWLLVDDVQKRDLDGRWVLEVGCGAGLAALAAARRGARCVVTDRNPEAVRLALRNARENWLEARMQGVVADLAAPFRLGAFDLVLFNPPYLPADPGQPVRGALRYALEGGPTGDEVIDGFLAGLERWHGSGMRIPPVSLVLSNHNDAQGVRERMARLGLPRVDRSRERRYFFHQIWVEHYQS